MRQKARRAIVLFAAIRVPTKARQARHDDLLYINTLLFSESER